MTSKIDLKSIRSWLVELNDTAPQVNSLAELIKKIQEAEQMGSGRLSVCVDGGPCPWWERFLGKKRNVDSLFALEWHGEYASLIFHDENWSEYRAMDKDSPVQPEEKIRVKIAHGEAALHPVDECMSRSRAFTAARSFLESGVRPDWLAYRFIE
jgi:hypothetical protein